MRRSSKKFRRKGLMNRLFSGIKENRSSSHGASNISDVKTRRSGRRKKGFLPFAKQHFKPIAMLFAALVIIIVCIVLLTTGNETTVATADMASSSSASPTSTVSIGEYDEDQEYSYEGVDENILAGLAGTDESLFSDDNIEEESENVLKIGITIGNITTDNDEIVIGKLEEAAGAAEEQGLVKVYFYDAGGDYNQQLQNMRSLIKNEVDVIIIGASDAECFNMVSYMASEEGIPVVTYDAPVATGYAVNVVADQSEWGSLYGEFMAENLSAGNIVQILGSDDSAIDAERKHGIDSALLANSNIVTAGTSYALWKKDKAKEAMDVYLSQDLPIDGVITEEGMAQGVIESYIDAGTLPKVMCGDVTAGFIKIWYALINDGYIITTSADEEITDNANSDDPGATQAAAQVIKAQAGELVVCAQPAPSDAAAAAFQIALKLAEGRSLKTQGATCRYTSGTWITDDNLAEYYAAVKDMADTSLISGQIDEEWLESLFDPAEETVITE